MMADIKQAVPVEFYECSEARAREKVRESRWCKWWVYDWEGYNHTPAATAYRDQLIAELEAQVAQELAQCESGRYAAQTQPESALRLAVASNLDGVHGGVGNTVGGSASGGIEARLSVPFGAAAGDGDTGDCSGGAGPGTLPRELFVVATGFDYLLHQPTTVDSNFRWEFEDLRENMTPEPYFALYHRKLVFYRGGSIYWIGVVRLVADQVADLWVHFDPVPIPDALAAMVDPQQPLDYAVAPNMGYVYFAASMEVRHEESGQVYRRSVYGADHPLDYMGMYSQWPEHWLVDKDADGIIRHHNFVWGHISHTYGGEMWLGLPDYGTFTVRYLLRRWYYDTLERDAIWMNRSLSPQRLRVSSISSVTADTAGVGLIQPLEVTYTRGANLSNIVFDAAADTGSIGTFIRCAIKAGNPFDFVVGLVVGVAGWKFWLKLEPGQTRYLACAAPLLQPAWPSVYATLCLSAPNVPETDPAGQPALKLLGSTEFIKIYDSAANYGFPSELGGAQIYIKAAYPVITEAANRPLVSSADYRFGGAEYIWNRWPWYHPSLGQWAVINYEYLQDGLWVPVEAAQIWLTREMMRQVATLLGVVERVLIDADDLRWFPPDPVTGIYPNRLWCNRLYTQGGALIDQAAIRAAFQLMIDANLASWPDWRNLVIHPDMRFGAALNDSYGLTYIADCVPLQGDIEGYAIEVASLADLGQVGTRFLYKILPQFQ